MKPGAAARTYAADKTGPKGGPRPRHRDSGVAPASSRPTWAPGTALGVLNQGNTQLLADRALGQLNSDPRMGYQIPGKSQSQIAFGTMGDPNGPRPMAGDATSMPPGLLAQFAPPAPHNLAGTRYGRGDEDRSDGLYNNPLSFYDRYMDEQRDRITEMMQLRDLAIAEGQNEVAKQYNDQISSIQSDIDDAQKSKVEVASAFERYRGTVDPYLQGSVDAAAATDLSGVAAVADVDAVTAQFNSGVAAVDDVLAKIAPGNADLAAHVEGSVREFQAMAEDSLREDMGNMYRVAEAGQKFAENMALALQQQDETMTDIDRQKIEIGINQQIEQMQEQLADTQKAKADAMASVAREYADAWGVPEFFETSEEAFGAVLGEWMGIQGLNPDEQEGMISWISNLRGQGVEDRKSAEAYLRDMVADFNYDRLNAAVAGRGGLEAILENVTDVQGAEVANRLLGLINQWAANPDAMRREMEAEGFLVDQIPAEDLQRVSDFRLHLDAYDMYREHNEKWNENAAYSKTYGNALADSYGYQGGTSGRQGRKYEGADLDKLIYDAALYAFGGDEAKARLAQQSGVMQLIVRRESGGYVGRLNYAGTAELQKAGLDVQKGFNTQAFLHLLEDAGIGKFGNAWPAGQNGKRHSASGLGQLNASNYRRYASEFGGANAVGNPFAEMVAAIRYAEGAHGSLPRARAFIIKNGNW